MDCKRIPYLELFYSILLNPELLLTNKQLTKPVSSEVQLVPLSIYLQTREQRTYR